jgi:hypothetical protein
MNCKAATKVDPHFRTDRNHSYGTGDESNQLCSESDLGIPASIPKMEGG